MRLDEPLDAGERMDAPPDAPPLDGAGDGGALDAGADAPDAAARPCVSGIEIGPSPATAPAAAPTLAGTGTGGLLALLLPPPARATAATRTALYVLDAEGAVLSVEEVDLDDGTGAPAETATVHRRRDAPGVLVLGPTEARLRDEGGAWTSIALPLPPLVARQREAGWLDDARFAYVAEGAGEPLVVIEPAGARATVTSLATGGAARVLVAPGAVVVSPAPPIATITEHDAALALTLELDWPTGPLGGRLLGATLAGGRRWLLTDGEEFRTVTALHRVEATGPTLLLGETLLGPLTTRADDDLVTIVTADGALLAFDFARDAFLRFLPSGARSLGLVERAGPGFVILTREPGTTAEVLVLRCVAP